MKIENIVPIKKEKSVTNKNKYSRNNIKKTRNKLLVHLSEEPGAYAIVCVYSKTVSYLQSLCSASEHVSLEIRYHHIVKMC